MADAYIKAVPDRNNGNYPTEYMDFAYTAMLAVYATKFTWTGTALTLSGALLNFLDSYYDSPNNSPFDLKYEWGNYPSIATESPCKSHFVRQEVGDLATDPHFDITYRDRVWGTYPNVTELFINMKSNKPIIKSGEVARIESGNTEAASESENELRTHSDISIPSIGDYVQTEDGNTMLVTDVTHNQPIWYEPDQIRISDPYIPSDIARNANDVDEVSKLQLPMKVSPTTVSGKIVDG